MKNLIAQDTSSIWSTRSPEILTLPRPRDQDIDLHNAPLDKRVNAFGLGRVVNCWTSLMPATAENIVARHQYGH